MTLKSIISEVINYSSIPLINGNKLTEKHRLLYLFNHIKFGETSCKHGETVEESIHARYRGSYSAMFSNPEFVVFITNGNPMDDIKIRLLAHEKNINKTIGFDAITPMSRMHYEENSESLLDYRHEEHFDTLKEIIKEYLNIASIFDTKPRITPRTYQPRILKEINKIFKINKTVLFIGYTGIGKTLMSLETAGHYCKNGGVCLVTTPAVDTLTPYKNYIQTYNFTKRTTRIKYIDANNIEEYRYKFKSAKKDKIFYVVVLSVQDIFRTSSNEAISDDHLRRKFECLPRFDIWIKDEVHFYYGGVKTAKKIDKIVTKKCLDLTATPQNILTKYEDNIVDYDLVWGIKNREITDLPFASIDIMTNFIAPSSMRDLYTDEEGFHAKKFFAYNKETGNFLMETDIIECIEKMYYSSHPKDKNKLSISGDPELCRYSKKYGMMILPEGTARCSVDDYIPALTNLLNDTFSDKNRLYLSTEDIKKNRKARSVSDYVDMMMEKHNKTNCVILTHRKLILGTDIPKLGHIVLFDNITDPKTFIQLLGRSIRSAEGKINVKMYSFSSQLELVYTKLSLYSSINPEVAIEQLLSCMPLSIYTETGLTKITAIELLKTANKIITKRNRSILSSHAIAASLTAADYSLWDKYRLSYTSHRTINKSSIKLSDGKGKAKSKSMKKTTKKILPHECNMLIEDMCNELPHISFIEQTKDLEVLLNNKLFKDLVGYEFIAFFKEIVDNNKVLKTNINNKLCEFDDTVISDWMVYDSIFDNSKHKQSIGLVFTPLQAAIDLVDKLHHLNPKKIAVINSLSGIIPLLLKIIYPNAEITCIEYFSYYKKHLKSLGFNVMDADGIHTMPKFDLIAGNPPYQDINKDGSRKDQKSNLWSFFTHKCWNALPDNSTLAFITPNSWINESKDYKKIDFLTDIFKKHNTITLNINECKKHFDVGSSFSFFVVEKTPKNKNNLTEIITPDGTFFINLDDVNWIPGKNITENAFNINKKTMFSNDRLETTQRLDVQKSTIVKKELKKEANGAFVYPYYHTKASGVLYGSRQHKHTDKNKVCISLSGEYAPNVNNNLGYSKMNVTYFLNSNETLDGASSVFNSRLYHFLLNNNKWAGFINIKMIKRLPYLDMSKIWSDDDIYKHFSLTDEEIKLVESNIK